VIASTIRQIERKSNRYGRPQPAPASAAGIVFKLFQGAAKVAGHTLRLFRMGNNRRQRRHGQMNDGVGLAELNSCFPVIHLRFMPAPLLAENVAKICQQP